MALVEGYAIISVYVENKQNVNAYFWNNKDFSGTAAENVEYNNINQDWQDGPVTSTQGDNISVRFISILIPPQNDSYIITYEHDDGGRVKLNGSYIIDEWQNGIQEHSTTISLTEDLEYPLEVELYEDGGHANAILYWEYTGQSKEVIPSQYFMTRDLVQGTSLNVTIGSFDVPEPTNNTSQNQTYQNTTEEEEPEEETIITPDTY